MMNNRTLGLLVLAILLMLALVFLADRPKEPEGKLGEPVLPGLDGNLNSLEEISFASADKKATLERQDKRWQVVHKDGYPADFEKLISVLDALAGATYEERKTTNPDNFGILQLQNIGKKSSQAVLFQGRAGEQAFRLLIGTEATSGRGRFVRHPGDEQVWLVDQTIEASAAPIDWVDPVIIDVPVERVVAIQQRSVNGDELSARRVEGKKNLVVTNFPEGEELRYSGVANQLARALVNVRLTDVTLRGEDPADTAMAVFELDNGGKVRVNAWQQDDRHFLTFDLQNMDEQPSADQEPSADQKPSADEQLSADREASPADDTRWTAAANLQAWKFEVSSSVYDKFTRTMADMIAEDEQADTGE